LQAQGIHGRGVDLNPEMVRRCRERGLDVSQGDALEYLAALPDASIDGVFAAQVIEHLPPDRLLQLLALARDKVRPGGRVVLETINPACWYAYFSSYILDLTHVRPIHPETLRYLMSAGGFDPVEIRYSSPYPREHKLRPVPLSVLGHAPDLADLVEAFNGNVEKLNALIFTHLDYAGIGQKKE
ncbi:MAG TPA: methyltransferase domain-containing protein, partial [Vicinamibacterales bacterium]|nr:methyltransferase domain-containing protein [Vicinamibacterales bacterium]